MCTTSSTERLTIVLSAGLSDEGRKAALAFGAASAAQAEGTRTTVFLAREAAVLSTPTGGDGVRPEGFADPLATYVQHFLDLGGQLEVCPSCLEQYCQHLPKDATGRPALRPKTRVQKLNAVASRVMEERVVAF